MMVDYKAVEAFESALRAECEGQINFSKGLKSFSKSHTNMGVHFYILLTVVLLLPSVYN